MSELLLPGAVLLGSLGLTYFVCLRPMRRGQCATAPGSARFVSQQATADQHAEIARLRQELAELRAAVPTPQDRDPV